MEHVGEQKMPGHHGVSGKPQPMQRRRAATMTGVSRAGGGAAASALLHDSQIAK
jgi:hypothetical protein